MRKVRVYRGSDREFINCTEIREEFLGRICHLYRSAKLKRKISYLENLNTSEEIAYKNLINFALIFRKEMNFSSSNLPTII